MARMILNKALEFLHKPSRRPRALDHAPHDYWDNISENWHYEHASLWREQSDQVNRDLFERWVGKKTCDRLLKTDCFDELAAEGLYPLLQSRSRNVVMIDISSSALLSALNRHPGILAAATDVRHLPFEEGSFDTVLSLSTLDHLESQAHISMALRELCRVLQPGGQLLLTMDNLANPIIALRNALPLDLLQRLGIVPYFLGASCGPERLRQLVEDAGFKVRHLTAVSHSPRVLVVQLARLVEQHLPATAVRAMLNCLLVLERLENLPTRFLTGHFIAVEAIKP